MLREYLGAIIGLSAGQKNADKALEITGDFSMRLEYMQMPKVGPSSEQSRQRNLFSRIIGSNLTRGAVALGTMLLTSAPLISRADEGAKATPAAKCESEFKVKRDDVLRALENARGKEIDVTKGGQVVDINFLKTRLKEGRSVPRDAVVAVGTAKQFRFIQAGNFEIFIDPVNSEITIYKKGTKTYRIEDQIGVSEGAAGFRPEDRDYFPELKADLKYATVVLINADTLVMADGYKVYLYNSDGRGFMTSFNEIMALNSKPLVGFLTKEARIAAVIARDDSLRDINEIVSITINSQTLASSDPRKVCIEEGALAVLTPPNSF